MTASTTVHPSGSESIDDMIAIDMLMHWDIMGYRGHMPPTSLEDAGESWHPFGARSAREMFEHMRSGGLTAAHASVAIFQNARAALSVVANWQRQIHESSDLVMPVKRVADIEKAKSLGRTGIMLGFQNTDPFENDLNLVGAFRELGVLIAQLTYNQQNAIAGGGWDQPDGGLTKQLGRSMVREMNEIGMLIDLSHCGEQTCLDTIRFSEQPVAITHANPVEFVNPDDWASYRNTRNKSISVLKELGAAGGVVGFTTYTRLLPDREDTTLDRFCEMIEWTAERIGIEHVAFGSDFGYGYNEIDRAWVRQGTRSRDAVIKWEPLSRDQPEWTGPGGMRTIAQALLGRGWSADDVSAFLGGNWVRLLSEVVG